MYSRVTNLVNLVVNLNWTFHLSFLGPDLLHSKDALSNNVATNQMQLAAATAKSLQLYPTLCDPRDSSPDTGKD